jgi:diacylglycerol kinase family enzyme
MDLLLDGFLDIIHIHPVPRYKIPLLFLKFIKGEHLKFPFVTTYRCKEIEILSEEPLAVNVDGGMRHDNTGQIPDDAFIY